MIAFHLVCVEVGACGIRLVCLLLNLTGLDRFVAASYGDCAKIRVKTATASTSVVTARDWGCYNPGTELRAQQIDAASLHV